jgi:hypothetical protein
MDARIEAIFREESRRALGGERMTLERLIREISEFPTTAPPEESVLLLGFLRGVVASVASTGPEAAIPIAQRTVSGAQKALVDFRTAKEAALTPEGAPVPVAATVPPQRPAATRFSVPYGPRAVPRPAPAPEFPADDIEDFTATVP